MYTVPLFAVILSMELCTIHFVWKEIFRCRCVYSCLSRSNIYLVLFVCVICVSYHFCVYARDCVCVCMAHTAYPTIHCIRETIALQYKKNERKKLYQSKLKIACRQDFDERIWIFFPKKKQTILFIAVQIKILQTFIWFGFSFMFFSHSNGSYSQTCFCCCCCCCFVEHAMNGICAHFSAMSNGYCTSFTFVLI